MKDMIVTDKEVYDAQCRYCKVVYQILANRGDIQEWLQGSGYIQDVLSYLSASERELLISGTCDNCWKSMFGSCEEEEEEEDE
jgi:hypothetical protein